MGQHSMEHGHGNVYGTIVSIVLVFIAKFTLSDGAAIAAIFAGLTTGGYNLYRFYTDRKKQKTNGPST